MKLLNSLPENGIIFFFHKWSSYSLMSLNYLKGIIPENVRLYIIEEDAENYEEIQNLLNFRSHGYGETFFIYDYEVRNKVLQFQKETSIYNDYVEDLSFLIQNKNQTAEDQNTE